MISPVLAEIYSTILPSMPYIVGAYVLIWVALFVLVVITARGLKKTEKQLDVIEETLLDSQDTLHSKA